MNTATNQLFSNVTSVIRWFGGKHYLAKTIIPLLPLHHCYIEPFGGGGHTLCRKAPSKVEVYNDVDQDLINFFMVLRNREEELVNKLKSLPTSRFLTEKWQREPFPKEDEMEWAVRWYYLLRHTIVPANNVKSGFRAGVVKNSAFDYQNSLDRLKAFRNRFRNVMIENLDFREIIRRYDSDKSLFFIDPPYVGRENLYKGGFTEKDHRDLAYMLKHIRGKAFITYYEDPLILELYPDWNQLRVEAIIGTGVHKASQGQRKKRATELFLMNY